MIKNKPQDYLPQNERFNGIYRGVVENNKDPEQMGRCQIRIFGVHSEKLDEIPMDHLPWAEPALGLFEGGVSGFGSWSVPLQGSHVFLFFENGNHLQPRYFASAPGKPTTKEHGFEGNTGFKDPDGQYPTEHRLNQPDFHKLTRNDIESTIVEAKKEHLEEDIETGDGGTWSELEIEGKREYPNNIVYATHGGIIIELDNSMDGQRIHIFHPSNSYIEIGPEGDMIIKNNQNKFTIVEQDDNELVKNNKNTTVKNNYNVFVKNNKNIIIEKDKIEEIKGDLEQEAKNISRKASNYDVQSSNTTLTTSGNHTVDAGGIVQITGSMIQLN